MSVVSGFYNVTVDQDGERRVSDFWEHALSEIEGVAAAAFKHVIEDRTWPPSALDRDALASWVALQSLRTTSLRNMMAEAQSIGYRMIVGVNGIAKLRQVMEHHLRRPVADAELEAEWEDLTKPGGTQIIVNPADHIQSIQLMIKPIAERIFASGMALWRFDRKMLVTSDAPVVPLGDGSSAVRGTGFYNAEVLAVPMSRFTALAIGVPGEQDAELAGTVSIAKAFNGSVSAYARKWVVSHPEDEPEDLYLSFNQPRPSEIQPPDLSEFLFKDRPLEETYDIHNPPADEKENNLLMIYPGWPLPDRFFNNPYAPKE